MGLISLYPMLLTRGGRGSCRATNSTSLRFLTFVRNDSHPVISTEGRNLIKKLRRVGFKPVCGLAHRQDYDTPAIADSNRRRIRSFPSRMSTRSIGGLTVLPVSATRIG